MITTNYRAIKVYQHIGFEKNKVFKSFKKTDGFINKNISKKLIISINPKLDLPVMAQLEYTKPSMGDQLSHLKYNLANEHVAVARISNHLVGYVIYQYRTGRISQIAVKERYRHQGYGTALINFAIKNCEEKILTLHNVPEECIGEIIFLTDGFTLMLPAAS